MSDRKPKTRRDILRASGATVAGASIVGAVSGTGSAITDAELAHCEIMRVTDNGMDSGRLYEDSDREGDYTVAEELNTRMFDVVEYFQNSNDLPTATVQRRETTNPTQYYVDATAHGWFQCTR